MIWLFLSALSLLIWVYLLFGRGFFWRVSTNRMEPIELTDKGRRIAIVIPARDEAETIGSTLESLLGQSLENAPDIVLVDDGSSDGTAEIARQVARKLGGSGNLTVLHGSPLVPGWTGKLWAMEQGFEYAARQEPDYVLFTDADITHERNSLLRLIDLADRKNLEMVSCMAKLACGTVAERALIPAFVFFFLQLYPPAWVASPERRTAAAAGGCVLLRPQALREAGGLQAIRGNVIDDCALARLLKRNGSRIWLGLTDDVSSTRSYRTVREIGRMISRSAFSQLRHSTLLLAFTVAGLILTYLIPLLAVIVTRGLTRALGILTLGVMAGCYSPMVRFYRQPILWAFSLPLVAFFYLSATIHSAVQYWRGQGGEWKGRAQDT